MIRKGRQALRRALLAVVWVASAAGCGLDASGCQSVRLPASGQTAAYRAERNDDVPEPVPVGDDGTTRRGAPLAFRDNGDGTVTDGNTGLVWEKKSADGGLHDKDALYAWSAEGTRETIWDWLEDLNAAGGTGFAGYPDWRIPNIRELHSILDYGVAFPKPPVAPAFDSGCVPGCSVLACSCTDANYYWSSTTVAHGPRSAWIVGFALPVVEMAAKAGALHVRAVRGGS